MADLYKNFKSQTEIESTKDANRKARQLILEKAKRDYEINEAKKEKARRQGEGTWMLDSVSKRITQEEKDIYKAKKKAKKKSKKKKKKKSKSSSSSDSDSDGEATWVEASAVKEDMKAIGNIKGPQLQRQGWMEAPLDQLIPMTSRQDIRDAINREKEEARRAAEKAQEPGQHARELNPYWKNGGAGLPQEKPKVEEKKKSITAVPRDAMAPSGDAGYSWLQKAYTRCVQQAEEEGRDLEEVAAERWGSLKKLKKMLADAKEKATGVQSREDSSPSSARRRDRSHSKDRERRRDRSESRDSSECRDRERIRRRDRSRSNERRGDRSRSKERRRHRSRERERSISHSRERNDKRDSRRPPQTSRFKRPGSDNETDSRNRNQASRSSSFRRPSSDDDNDDGNKKRSSRFMKPSDSAEERLGREREEYSRSDKRRETEDRRDDRSRREGMFMKPEESDSRGRGESDRDRRRESSPNDAVPRWKKKSNNVEEPVVSKEKARTSNERDSREKKKRRSRSKSSSSSDSSESSASEEDGVDSEAEGANEETKREPPPKVLSEEELNDLAAKILRAEIMGDDDVAADLKGKLEAARQLREASKSDGELESKKAPDFSHRRRAEGGGRHNRGGKRGEEGEEEEDNVVVLSRTNKSGMVRPVVGEATSEMWGGARPGKKRKKAVTTHDVSGERTIYFDDDNKFDLKSLVEQEKAGTSEDQNSMFARLAGRAGDRDLDVDDMFVSKAARKQNEEGAAARDRSAAIFEHRKISAAMEKCNRCFDKVPKHLIIAIGTKSYLCLPPHRSLTEGHCLIVPMQHVASCTSVDEDVWREMQLFRKSLVQMFLAQDEDVVVMETVMHLKHFRHTAIECIPLEKETGDLAPIYFKKAIQEAGPEWADNKKLHSLRDKDVRHVIPKGFPYFSVDFGLQGGYATVIEDEQTFPSYFGREIVGGMVDAEPALWRKPHKQSFEDQRQKVLKFEAMWKPFDFTQNLGAGD